VARHPPCAGESEAVSLEGSISIFFGFSLGLIFFFFN